MHSKLIAWPINKRLAGAFRPDFLILLVVVASVLAVVNSFDSPRELDSSCT